MTDPDLILPKIQETEARYRRNLLLLVDELELLAALRRTIDKDEKAIKALYAELTSLANEETAAMTS